MAETEIIFSAQESPEGGYEARALGYDIFTQAESMDELREMVRDAVRCHFDEGSVPAVIPVAHGEGRGYSCVKLPRDLSGHELAKALRRYGYEVTGKQAATFA
jgi:hypothetical protein